MRKFLSIFTVTTTLIGLAGCSQSEITEPVVDTNQPVEIKVAGKTLGITSHTRAPFEGDGQVAIDARLIVSSTDLNYTTMVANDTIEFAAGADSGFDPAVPYPHSTNSVYLVGLYPPAAEADWTIASGSASFTFDGTHDVMATRQVETKRTDGTASPTTYPLMTFHHLLTRLNLCVQAEDEAAQAAWGGVTSITVKSPNGIAITFEKEATPPTASTKPTSLCSGTAIDFPFYNKGLDTKFTIGTIPLQATTPTAQSYSLVAPPSSTTTEASYDLLVVTDNHAGYAINVPLKNTGGTDYIGDARGLQFDITLTFTATNIMAKATVNKWEDGGTGGGTIQ